MAKTRLSYLVPSDIEYPRMHQERQLIEDWILDMTNLLCEGGLRREPAESFVRKLVASSSSITIEADDGR